MAKIVDVRMKILESYFEQIRDPGARRQLISAIVQRLAFDAPRHLVTEEELLTMRSQVRLYAGSMDRDEYMQRLVSALEPIVRWHGADLDGFEASLTRAVNRSHGYLSVNRLIAVHVVDGIVHIHHGFGAKVEGKLLLYRSAMATVAQLMERDDSIREAWAASWIIGCHPRLFERLGFDMTPVTEAEAQAHFPGEARTIMLARMSRERCLRLYA